MQALCPARAAASPHPAVSPQTNGKAERFIQTLLREWAYGAPYTELLATDACVAAVAPVYNGHAPTRASVIKHPPPGSQGLPSE